MPIAFACSCAKRGAHQNLKSICAQDTTLNKVFKKFLQEGLSKW